MRSSFRDIKLLTKKLSNLKTSELVKKLILPLILNLSAVSLPFHSKI